MSNRPTKESLSELPELDLSKAKNVRRGPRAGRVASRLTLRQIREATGTTQVALAEKLATGQAEISRLERREDMSLSTLRRYAAALGAECEVVFVFPKTGHRIVVAEAG